MFKVPEQHRITKEIYEQLQRVWMTRSPGIESSFDLKGNNGFFILPNPKTMKGRLLMVLATDGEGWDHVSVSIPTERRCPTWEEMCFVKDQFWSEEDTVVQFHPPHSQYVNNHEFCLHLWRKQNFEQPLPNSILVGIKM